MSPKIFIIVLVLAIVLMAGFMYQVFIKTESCAIDPLNYWTKQFSNVNGDFTCNCIVENKMNGGGFSFSSYDPNIKLT